MENNSQDKKGFSYTYSAKEQAELQRIRDKYTPSAEAEKENKMERLRKLDASVNNIAQTVAIILGVIGTLILGFGMSLIMTDISKILGEYQDMAMIIGIVIGIVGGVIVSLAYPIYNIIVKVRRKKIAPEIIRLTDELMK